MSSSSICMWASGAVGRVSVADGERGVGRDQDRGLELGRQFVFRVASRTVIENAC